MSVLAKIWWLSSILTTIVCTSYSNVIPAAIIRRHTITYKDVPAQPYQAIQHPVVYVPSSMVNLFVHFRSKSSQVHLKQVHKGNVGQVQHTKSEDEPHYLKHEIRKPVIQTIKEVIVPYRQVIQEIKPVVEEVKTIVSSGVPKSNVYMNFGSKYSSSSPNTNENYRYLLNTNHELTHPYNSAETPASHSNWDQNENINNLYDLTSIYGIKPSVDHSTSYLMPFVNKPKINYQSNDHNTNSNNNPGVTSPLIYGLTSDIETDSGNSGGYGYKVGYENSVENNVQNNGYGSVISGYDQYNNMDQRPVYHDDNNYKNYDQNYNYVTNIEPQYYVNEMENKNNDNSNDYFSDINTSYESESKHNTNSRYVTQNAVNSQYSDGYSDDLATSDGSAYGKATQVVPLLGPFASLPISKSSTLASLAQMISSLPYQYSYDNSMNIKRNS